MPKSKTHKVIGTSVGIIGAIAYGLSIKRDRENLWQYALGGAIGGYTTARLADVLEPSQKLGPNHRGIFHGAIFNGTVIYSSYAPGNKWLQSLIDKANDYNNSDKHFEAFLCRLAAGYIVGLLAGHTSHLLADLNTPHGLPILA